MKILIILFTGILMFLPMKRENFLSIENTNSPKGIFQITIILHHLSQTEQSIKFLNYFQNMGVYSVGFFFFISMYGLCKQISKDREKYLQNFFKKRFLKILIPVVIVTLLCLILKNSLLNQEIGLLDIKNIYFRGSSLINNGWYLNSILIVYLLFYFSFKISVIEKTSKLIFSTLVLCYVIILNKIGFGIWWYNSMLLLIFGIWYSSYEEKFDIFFEKYYKILMPITVFNFVFLEKYASILLEKIGINIPYWIVQNILCINFCIMVFLICKKINFKNKLLQFFGSISFEMYMVHGVIIQILNKYMGVDFVFMALVFALTIISSYFLNNFFKKIYRICKI